jgi:hypothetical protein
MARIEKQHIPGNRLPGIREIRLALAGAIVVLVSTAALCDSPPTAPVLDSSGPLIGSTAATLDSSAPEATGSPAGTLVKSYTYDFDEDMDSDGQPDGWQRPADRTYPHYVPAGLDFTVAQSGNGSLRISAGGAPAIFLSPSIALTGTAAYDVTGYVKTDSLPSTGLRASSACIEALLYDRNKKLLASVKAFPEMTGTTDWTPVSLIDVTRKYPDAVTLVVAAAFEGVSLEGAAWFDTIKVQRRPLAFFKTNKPGNAFHLSDKKVFSFEGRGLEAGTYELNMAVHDADGLKTHEAALKADAAADGSASAQYTLPDLPSGPYTIDVDLAAKGVSVLKQSIHMGVMPDYKDVENARNFGISLSDVPEKSSADMEMTADFGTGWVKMPLNNPEASAKASYLQIISELRRAGITPVGILDLPSSGSRTADDGSAGGDLLSRIQQGPDSWTPLLGDSINTFAGSVQWWQLGHDADAPLGQLQKSAEAYDRLKAFINGVSFQARVGLPVAAVADITPTGARMADFFVVSAPALQDNYKAESAPPLPEGAQVWAWTDMSDWVKGTPGQQASQAAADIAGLFAGGAQVLFLQDPWRRLGIVDNEGSITPFAIALGTIIHELSNYTYSGTFAFPSGTPNAIFTSGDSIRVLLWPSAQPKEERLFLGDSVEIVDMYGRRTRAEMVDGENSILVKDGPIFLEGLDPGTVETRKTFAIEPGVIDSVYEMQPVYVSFTNKFSNSIMGELTLTFPKGWEAQPKLFFVRLKPGEAFRGRANLVVPYNALAGIQDIGATLNLGGAQKTTIIRRVELGSQSFKVEIETRASGSGITVYQKVTNVSDTPVEITAFLEGSGLERVERLPRQLDKGATTTFSYILGDAAGWQGRKLMASVRERQTNRFLNVEFTIGAPQAAR